MPQAQEAPPLRRRCSGGSLETTDTDGVFGPEQAHQGWVAPQWLRHRNIELRVPKKEGALAKLRKVHHKLMVIDDRIVVAGSFNYKQRANDNDENLFVVGSPHSEGRLRRSGQGGRSLAVHMGAEIERLFALSEPFVPTSP